MTQQPDIQESAAYFRQFIATDGDLTPDQILAIWSERARALARLPEEDITSKTVDYLLLQCGEMVYGIDIRHVVSIVPVTQITAVPRTPEFVKGVVSVRGRILSVIDVAEFLQMSGATGTIGKIIWVIDDDNQMETGLLVDDVVDVQTVFHDDIQPVLSTQTGRQAAFISGILPDMSLLLNVKMLLAHPDFIVYEDLL